MRYTIHLIEPDEVIKYNRKWHWRDILVKVLVELIRFMAIKRL